MRHLLAILSEENVFFFFPSWEATNNNEIVRKKSNYHSLYEVLSAKSSKTVRIERLIFITKAK